MSKLAKYSLTSVERGAAPEQNVLQASKPSFCLIFEKIRVLATRYPKVGLSILQLFYSLVYRCITWEGLMGEISAYPFIRSKFLCKPWFLAQVAMCLLTNPASALTDFIFSAIFSQTRGTPRNLVGLTSCNVFINPPFKASLFAKYTIVCPTRWQ